MADLGETFYPAAIPESEHNFEPIPAGMYEVQITESEVKPSRSGQMLVLTLDVIGPKYAGRKLWDRLNIQNASQEAQAIAQRALADLFLATGTAPSRNSEDLHFKPLLARVAIKGDPTYGPKNVIKAYKPKAAAARAAAPSDRAAAPAQPQRRPAPAAPPKAAEVGNRPWNRTAAAPAAAAIIDDDIPF